MIHRTLPTNEKRWSLYEQASLEHGHITASAQMCLTEYLGEFPSLRDTAVLPMQFDYPASRHRDCPAMRWSVDFNFPRSAVAYDVWKFYGRLQKEIGLLGPIKEEWVDGGYLIYFDATPDGVRNES